MARFSEEELEEIRRNTDIVALIESYGTTLKQRPDVNEYVGLCPLHDDKEASLHVNRAKGVWHCKSGCGGGDCFQWVMKAEGGISFKLSVDLIKNKAVGLMAGNGTKAKFVPRFESPIAQSASDQELIFTVAEYYHQCLAKNGDALAYLAKRGLNDSDAIQRFKIGFCDRTLGHRIPNRQTQAGAEQRAKLDALGILKETGHESMRGCITFPVIVSEGKAGELYGRRITKGTPENERHWYLKGPHVGVWNAEAFGASDTIILCEGIIDALTFWIAGFRNVTATFGKSGFTDVLYQAFIKHDTKRCYISFDNDSKNDRTDNAAMMAANRLMAQGIECFRIEYPLNANDTNAYAMMLKDGNGSAHGPLQMLINKAVWLGKQASGVSLQTSGNTVPKEETNVERLSSTVSAAPSEASARESEPTASSLPPKAWKNIPPACELFEQAEKRVSERQAREGEAASLPQSSSLTPQASENLPLLGAKTSEHSANNSANQATVPAKMPTAASGIEVEMKENEILITIGNRNYRIRGLTKSSNTFDTMKINILVRKNDAFFVDTIDLYSARNRTHFVKEACRELGLEEEVLKRDLGKILQKLELIQDEFATNAAQAETKKIEISDPDKAKALELLRSENLLDRILSDFDACGVVGERTNKLVGYLAATSRKLERPLAIMVQSSSAAGKSSLMEAILRFMPMEEQVNYSAMTGQSLFYMGGMNLKNKILAIAEEEGIKQASYALKLLQSDGQLTIASTGKDPGTGRMETQNYHVEGPVMLFLTTTAIDVDEELLNRCLVLTVDEDPEQTRAIQTRQRERETLDGLISNKQRDSIVALHQNAHRLLRPLAVVNNYAHQLQFLTDQTRRRRDHVKYLTLIQSVALLHQYQREVKTIEIEGKHIEYIEVIPRDIQIANQLSNYVLGRSIDELAPQTRRLLLAMHELIRTECQAQQMELVEYRFTRRFLRERLKWGATQLRIHLDRLVEMEYVLIHIAGRGKVTQYELLFDGRGREGELTLCGLIDPSTLVDPQSRSPEREDSQSDRNLAGFEANLAGQTQNLAGAKRGQNGRVAESIGEVSPNEMQGEVVTTTKTSENAHLEDETMK
jgi:DNA primase catalytic core